MRLAAIWILSALSTQGSTTSRTVNVGDAVINYEITGAGAPLVLIHGWAQDLTIWDDQVREFSKHYRVLRYDRRGYGKSTGNADASADPMDLRILLTHWEFRRRTCLDSPPARELRSTSRLRSLIA